MGVVEKITRKVWWGILYRTFIIYSTIVKKNNFRPIVQHIIRNNAKDMIVMFKNIEQQ